MLANVIKALINEYDGLCINYTIMQNAPFMYFNYKTYTDAKVAQGWTLGECIEYIGRQLDKSGATPK